MTHTEGVVYAMSNRYDDSFVYAVDSHNRKHLVAQCYSASLGGGYRDMVTINDKTYSVFFGVDDIDMDTETIGTFLPFIGLIDCRSFFCKHPTIPMQQAINEAGLKNTDIVKIVWLHFERTAWSVFASEGWVISPNYESRVDATIFDDAISNFKEIELIADSIIQQIA